MGIWQGLVLASDPFSESQGNGVAGESDKQPDCDDDDNDPDTDDEDAEDNDEDDDDTEENCDGGGGRHGDDMWEYEDCPNGELDKGLTRLKIDNGIDEPYKQSLELPMVYMDEKFGITFTPTFFCQNGIDVTLMEQRCLEKIPPHHFFRFLPGDFDLDFAQGDKDLVSWVLVQRAKDRNGHTKSWAEDYELGSNYKQIVGIDTGCEDITHWYPEHRKAIHFVPTPQSAGVGIYNYRFDPYPPPECPQLDGEPKDISQITVSSYGLDLEDPQGFIKEVGKVPLLYLDQDKDGSNDLVDEAYEFKLEVTLPYSGAKLGHFYVWYHDDDLGQGGDRDEFFELIDDQGQVWRHGQNIPARTLQTLKMRALASNPDRKPYQSKFTIAYNPVDPGHYFDSNRRSQNGAGRVDNPQAFAEIYIEANVSELMMVPQPQGAVNLFSDKNEQALPDQELGLALVERGYQSRYYEQLHEEMEVDWLSGGAESGDGGRLDHDSTHSDEYGWSLNRIEMPGQIDQARHRSAYQVEAEIKTLSYKGRRNGLDILLPYTLKNPIVFDFEEVGVIPGTVASIQAESDKQSIAADSTSDVEISYVLRDRYGNLVPERAAFAQTNGWGEPWWLKQLYDGEIEETVVYESDSDGRLSIKYLADAYPGQQKVKLTAGEAEATVNVENLAVQLELDFDKDTIRVSQDLKEYAIGTIEATDSLGNPVADGTPIKVLAQNGMVRNLAGQALGGMDYLYAEDGQVSFMLDGAISRHDPEGSLILATCASGQSPDSVASQRIKVIHESDLLLTINGPMVLAGDNSEDTEVSIEYFEGPTINQVPIRATTELVLSGPPGALVKVFHANRQLALCYSCDLEVGDKLLNSCGPEHATNRGGLIDHQIYAEGSGSVYLAGAWLETPHSDALRAQEFRAHVQIRPEELNGNIFDNGDFRLFFNPKQQLCWELWTDQGLHQVESEEALLIEAWNSVAVGHTDGELTIEVNGVKETLEVSGRVRNQALSWSFGSGDYRGHFDNFRLDVMRLGPDSAGIIIEGLDQNNQVRLSDDHGEATLPIRSTGALAGQGELAYGIDMVAAEIVGDDFAPGDDDDGYEDDEGGFRWGKFAKKLVPAEAKLLMRGTQELAEMRQEAEAASRKEHPNEYYGEEFEDFWDEEGNLNKWRLAEWIYANLTDVEKISQFGSELVWGMTPIPDLHLLVCELILLVPTDREPDGLDPDLFAVTCATVALLSMGFNPALKPAAKILGPLQAMLRKTSRGINMILQRQIWNWLRALCRATFIEHSPTKVVKLVSNGVVFFEKFIRWNPKKVEFYCKLLKNTEEWTEARVLAANLGGEKFDFLTGKMFIEYYKVGPSNKESVLAEMRRVQHVFAHTDKEFQVALKETSLETFQDVYKSVQLLMFESMARKPEEVAADMARLGVMLSRTKGVPGVDRIELVQLLKGVATGGNQVPDLSKLMTLSADEWNHSGKAVMRCLRAAAEETQKGNLDRWSVGFAKETGVPSFTFQDNGGQITHLHSLDDRKFFDESFLGEDGAEDFFINIISIQAFATPSGSKQDINLYVTDGDLYQFLMEELDRSFGIPDKSKEIIRPMIIHAGDPPE